MAEIMSLREIKREHKLQQEQVQIRLPPNVRKQAKELANRQSTNERKLYEADVYRTAILLFLDRASTVSRETQGGETQQA